MWKFYRPEFDSNCRTMKTNRSVSNQNEKSPAFREKADKKIDIVERFKKSAPVRRGIPV